MSGSDPETDTVEVTVLKETPSAYQFLNLYGKVEWFPKSQVSFKSRNTFSGVAVAIIPEWLLKSKKW